MATWHRDQEGVGLTYRSLNIAGGRKFWVQGCVSQITRIAVGLVDLVNDARISCPQQGFALATDDRGCSGTPRTPPSTAILNGSTSDIPQRAGTTIRDTQGPYYLEPANQLIQGFSLLIAQC